MFNSAHLCTCRQQTVERPAVFSSGSLLQYIYMPDFLQLQIEHHLL